MQDVWILSFLKSLGKIRFKQKSNLRKNVTLSDHRWIDSLKCERIISYHNLGMIGLTTILLKKRKRLRNQMHHKNLFPIWIQIIYSCKDIKINIWRNKIITIACNYALFWPVLKCSTFIGFSLYYFVYFNSYYQGKEEKGEWG